MRNEPSVLLVDDEQRHEKFLQMMDLEGDGWTVEAAIDRTVAGATKKAIDVIKKHNGVTVLLLDILWHREVYGGIKVLHGIWEHFARKRPARRILIVTRHAINEPRVAQLADALGIPEELRGLQIETMQGRQRLKGILLDLWDQIHPK